MSERFGGEKRKVKTDEVQDLHLMCHSIQLKNATRDGDTVTVKSHHGSTPLHFTPYKGHVSVTIQLISARCNLDVQTEGGYTPLYYGAQQGHVTVTEQLIPARCNINLQTQDGDTPMYTEVRVGNAAVTKQLLAARFNVDLRLLHDLYSLNRIGFDTVYQKTTFPGSRVLTDSVRSRRR